MAFTNIWQWSETPASNTEIDGIDITGTTGKVKDGDNAIREMMSQIITTEGKGTAIASAATLTLSGPERYFHITGNTGPITDIDFTDAVDGRWAWLIFDSTPTITHNGTTLQLPGAANIVAEAGDRALFVQDSSDNVICVSYQRASYQPIVQGSWTPSVLFGGAAVGIAYANRSGVYVRHGNLVFLGARINLSSKGSSTGAMFVGGFPFTPSTNFSVTTSYYTQTAGLTSAPFGYASGAGFNVQQFGATGSANVTDANINNTLDWYFTCSFTV
jgi:hypothetical protein